MIKKIDLGAAMGGFAQVKDAEYIYAELADRSQVKIKKSDLLGAIFQYRGLAPSDDLNKAISSGTYKMASVSSAKLNWPNMSYGILIYIQAESYGVQIAFETRTKKIEYRTHASELQWGLWASVTFT